MHPSVPTSVGRKRVFDSVFPVPAKNTGPSIYTTPTLATTAQGKPFGGPRPSQSASSQLEQHHGQGLAAEEQEHWNQSWEIATTFLAFPDRELTFDFDDAEKAERCEGKNTVLLQWERVSPSQEVIDAIFYVAAPTSRGKILRSASLGLIGAQQRGQDHDLVKWYMNETRRHFLVNFRRKLLKVLDERANQENLLFNIVQYLKLVEKIYYTPFLKHVLPLLNEEDKEPIFATVRHGLYAIIRHSLPADEISDLLSREITKESRIVLGIRREQADTEADSSEYDQSTNTGYEQDLEMDASDKFPSSYAEWRHETSQEIRMQMMTESDDPQITLARERLLGLLDGLQNVGLGGIKAQKVFAEVMNDIMTECIKVTYSRQWESPSLATQHLQQWTENWFARLVVQVLDVLKSPDNESSSEDHLDVSLNDVKRWQDIGLARLGSLRISELFDIVVEWDSSSGAIEDLKQYVTNPPTRFYLTTYFISMIMQRLLHPGASTIEIIQLYISIIRSMNRLDPRGVLLDRIARPIRRYLRDREDTVKVIVGGLLAEVDADGQPVSSSEGTLSELSVELTKAHELSLREDSGELDWNDMSWVPDPIDAAPDYKKSKDSDVIGSLISLFDTKDAFVKELQNMLGDRLLKKTAEFEQEISVLELLKVRFGDSALQACEVMLRDVLDSKRVDAVIRRDQRMGPRPPLPQFPVTPDHSVPQPATSMDQPQLHAKILSRLFWPNLHAQSFKVPEEISALQARYSTGFESLKQSRKLTWLNGLGQVTVELDLEDRVFKDEVTTWQASVIYAFQSPEPPSDDPSPISRRPITKSVAELAQELEMSAALARSACFFWLSKRILVETGRDVFRVLEVLPTESEGGGEESFFETSMNEPHTPRHGGGAGANAAAAAEAAAQAAAKESADEVAMAKMNLYWQFIVGMLTNQGALPLQRIIMMLKIVVPGGFPFSNEELRDFLAGMVSKGDLEIVSGGNYKLRL